MTADDLHRELIDFADALRANGVPVDAGRVANASIALAALHPVGYAELYWATRLTMCSRLDDLVQFDALFRSRFGPADDAESAAFDPATTVEAVEALVEHTGDLADQMASDEQPRAGWAEQLAIGAPAIDADDNQARLERLVAELNAATPPNRTMRRRPGGHRELDLRRTLRSIARQGGELVRLSYRRRILRPRRFLLLIDVSQSMRDYTDPMLRFAHALVQARPEATEVFTLGTRLTRITEDLWGKDPYLALAAAYRRARDREGGTRLGETLRDLLRHWGGRSATRSAVTVVVSDGWVADHDLLRDQLPRLSRRSRRIVWLNPAAGRPGFKPAARALTVSGPYIDEFVAGYDLDALRSVAAAMARR